MALKRLSLIMLLVISIFFLTTYGTGSSLSFSDPTGNLSGYVTDTQMNPIPGARVRVSFHETYEEDYSDATGYYHVTNIPLCYCLKNATCSKSGYQSQWVLLSIGENTTYDFILTELGPDPYPEFNGTMGTNGWYVSCVNVTVINIENVDVLFYRLDGGQWVQYTETFPIYESGEHNLFWYWVAYGNKSETQTCTVKIDQDFPTIQLSYQRMSIGKILITAIAADAHSGIDRVEFILDGSYQGVDDNEPYEVLMSGIGIHLVQAVAYDCAGNFKENSVITPYHSQTFFPFYRLFLLGFLLLFFVMQIR
jgi:hypothetical protein